MNSVVKPILRKCCKVTLPRANAKYEAARYVHQDNENTLNYRTPEHTNVSESLIKEKLKASSIPFTNGYTCFHLNQGVLCSKKNCLNEGSVHVNKKTGFFICGQCHISGEWSVLSKLLDKSNSEEKQLIINQKCINYGKHVNNWKTVVDGSIPLKDLSLEDYENVLKSFKLTPVSKRNLTSLQIRINNDKNMLYLPLLCGSKVIGFKTFEKNGTTQTFPKNDCPGILFSKATKKNVNSAVLTARIQDFFALISQNLNYDILCLPHGGKNLPQGILPLLEHYDKLILWFGELGGLDSTGNFAKKLSEKRCFNVRPIKNMVSAEKALLEKEDLEVILKKATPTYHQFITTFNSLREDVFAELQNKERVTGVPWKKFLELNKILKGHRRGELTILTGPTGSGKTTFISEYSLDLAMQGVNTLWGSFEIRNCRLARTMLQQYSGIQLENNLQQFGFWADKFEQLPIYFMTFHGQQHIEFVMDTVEHCYYTYDIAHVIIDNVQFMIEVLPQTGQVDRFWKQDFLIQSFRSFATKNNCHVTLVMHPRKGIDGMDLSINSIFGGAKAAQEADNVLIIQDLGGFKDQKKYLQISKNRFCGELGRIPLFFDKPTFSFSKLQNSNLYESYENSEYLEENPEKQEMTEILESDYEEYSDSREPPNLNITV